MTEYKLVIPGQLPTLNEIINEAKAHWNNYRVQKENSTEKVAWVAIEAGLPRLNAVKLDITYYRKNRRHDPDNIAAAKKFILDGLVAAGVIENDGWKQVKGWTEKWEVDKKNPRTEIILIEIGEERDEDE